MFFWWCLAHLDNPGESCFMVRWFVSLIPFSILAPLQCIRHRCHGKSNIFRREVFCLPEALLTTLLMILRHTFEIQKGSWSWASEDWSLAQTVWGLYLHRFWGIWPNGFSTLWWCNSVTHSIDTVFWTWDYPGVAVHSTALDTLSPCWIAAGRSSTFQAQSPE